MSKHCPFCNRVVIISFDCTCGAKAVNKDLWINSDIPIMRSKFSAHEDVFFHKLDNGKSSEMRMWHIRDMLNENDYPILENHPLMGTNSIV